LAQNIEASLKASSERRFVQKAGKSYRRPTETNIRPDSNITKDSKDKSIIAEPFRQNRSESRGAV